MTDTASQEPVRRLWLGVPASNLTGTHLACGGFRQGEPWRVTRMT